MQTQKRSQLFGILAVYGALVVAFGAIVVFSVSANAPTRRPVTPQPPNVSNTVTLRAESWNNGYVHVWATLSESSDRYTDVRDGTRCRKLDSRRHKLGTGSTAIDYHRLDCNGTVGYVQWNQAR